MKYACDDICELYVVHDELERFQLIMADFMTCVYAEMSVVTT
jgi:hypothetical protein